MLRSAFDFLEFVVELALPLFIFVGLEFLQGLIFLESRDVLSQLIHERPCSMLYQVVYHDQHVQILTRLLQIVLKDSDSLNEEVYDFLERFEIIGEIGELV